MPSFQRYSIEICIDENYFYNPSLGSFDKRIVIKYNGIFIQSNLTSVDFLNFRIF